jgi:hypothetical protein
MRKIYVTLVLYDNNLINNLFMNDTIKKFIEELRALGLTPVIEGEYITLEFGFEHEQWKKAIKLFNQYIGFWKTIAIHTNHDKEKKIARFKIPFELITGVDLTDDQLLTICGRIGKQIRVPS